MVVLGEEGEIWQKLSLRFWCYFRVAQPFALVAFDATKNKNVSPIWYERTVLKIYKFEQGHPHNVRNKECLVV